MVEDNKLNLSRQSKLVPINEISSWNIKVFGVGSVGSHVVNVLAKTGFERIHVYDMDIVEEENIAPQAYNFEHIGLNKVEALADVVKKSSGVEITTHHGEVNEETEIEPEANTIYMCFFDSFEARKMVWNKVKDFPVIFIDARIGRYDMRHYLVNCSEQDQVEAYEDSFPKEGNGSDLVCGEKASAPINVQIAGMIVINLVCFLAGKDYTKIFIGNAATPANNINVLQLREKTKEEEEPKAMAIEI